MAFNARVSFFFIQSYGWLLVFFVQKKNQKRRNTAVVVYFQFQIRLWPETGHSLATLFDTKKTVIGKHRLVLLPK
jgi:hypothetical protein